MQNEDFMNDTRMWDDFIKREELECAPGVIDEGLVRALTLNTYMIHIRQLMDDGIAQFEDCVADQMENAMVDVFLCYTHVVEGRYPDVEEIDAYLKQPDNVDVRRNLTTLCLNLSPDTLPGAVNLLRGMLPDVDLSRIQWDTEERRQNAEKWRKRFEENGGIIEL